MPFSHLSSGYSFALYLLVGTSPIEACTAAYLDSGYCDYLVSDSVLPSSIVNPDGRIQVAFNSWKVMRGGTRVMVSLKAWENYANRYEVFL